MGCLHEGHLSLVRRARSENDFVAASLFVNPTQFGPNEDFSRYPRDLQRDRSLLESSGCDLLFAPAVEEMYPPGCETYVEVGSVAARLEGERRPGHFRGVATVVLKLLGIMRPTRAYFGQKDAQQLVVIGRMVRDLEVPVEIVGCPTVREADGLAMSSRNSYLGPEDRQAATVLYRALSEGQRVFDAHPGGAPREVMRAMEAVVAAEPRAALDYADVCDPDTFAPLEMLRAPALLAIAARVGPARLIDNAPLRADGTWDFGMPVAETTRRES